MASALATTAVQTDGSFPPFEALGPACVEVLAAAQQVATGGAVALTCSSDPVVVGTSLSFSVGGPYNVLAMSQAGIPPAAELSEYFAAGFVIIGTCWAIGKAVRLLLDIVRR